MDQVVYETLTKEIILLRLVLDQVNPGWENEILKEFSDTNMILNDSVCLPIRAAINLITQKEDLTPSNIHSDSAIKKPAE